MSNEYNVQPAIEKGKYLVHKWDESFGDKEIPDITYLVIARDGKINCNCPSGRYRGYCKHKEMVKEFRKLERAGIQDKLLLFKG